MWSLMPAPSSSSPAPLSNDFDTRIAKSNPLFALSPDAIASRAIFSRKGPHRSGFKQKLETEKDCAWVQIAGVVYRGSSRFVLTREEQQN
ncbi:hypothetical protein AAC387_Pa01g2192 [Persea americana]